MGSTRRGSLKVGVPRPASFSPLPARDEETDRERYVVAAQLSAVLAGGIHAAVVPEHLLESVLVAVFFSVVAVGQIALAWALTWRLPVRVLAAAVVAHVALVVLYVASRTIALPFLPGHHGGGMAEHLPVGNGISSHAGSQVEPVGVLDVCCLVTELVLIAALARLMPARARVRVTALVVLLGLLAVAGRGLTLLG